MTTLRLHYELYSAQAVEQAVSVFADHDISMEQQEPYFILTVEEERVARELGNYVLGLTIEEKRAAG